MGGNTGTRVRADGIRRTDERTCHGDIAQGCQTPPRRRCDRDVGLDLLRASIRVCARFLLLDARIRRSTGGRRSLADVMRRAYKRYSEDRGFTPLEFQRAAEDVAGVSLADWFGRYVSSTSESAEWTLHRRPDATPAQQEHLRQWVGGRATSVIPPRP